MSTSACLEYTPFGRDDRETRTTFATPRRTFTLERTWTVASSVDELFSNCCCPRARSLNLPNLRWLREAGGRLYARVTTGLTILVDPNGRRVSWLRLQMNLFAARCLDNDAEAGRGKTLFSPTFYTTAAAVVASALFTRLPRRESLARFSHGALHPLRVGEACERRTLDYSFLTRACHGETASHLKKVTRARRSVFTSGSRGQRRPR